jgi:hypothetical protein
MPSQNGAQTLSGSNPSDLNALLAPADEHSWFGRGARALEEILTPKLGDK